MLFKTVFWGLKTIWSFNFIIEHIDGNVIAFLFFQGLFYEQEVLPIQN